MSLESFRDQQRLKTARCLRLSWQCLIFILPLNNSACPSDALCEHLHPLVLRSPVAANLTPFTDLWPQADKSGGRSLNLSSVFPYLTCHLRRRELPFYYVTLSHPALSLYIINEEKRPSLRPETSPLHLPERTPSRLRKKMKTVWIKEAVNLSEWWSCHSSSSILSRHQSAETFISSGANKAFKLLNCAQHFFLVGVHAKAIFNWVLAPTCFSHCICLNLNYGGLPVHESKVIEYGLRSSHLIVWLIINTWQQPSIGVSEKNTWKQGWGRD